MNRQDFISGVQRPAKEVLRLDEPGRVFMGIDWGGGRDITSVCILTKYGNAINKVEHFDISEISIVAEVSEIEGLINKLKPLSVVSDLGYGAVQTQSLQRIFGERVKSCHYGGNPNRASYNQDTWMFTVDRDSFLQESRDLLIDKNPTPGHLHSLNYAYIAYCCYVPPVKQEMSLQ